LELVSASGLAWVPVLPVELVQASGLAWVPVLSLESVWARVSASGLALTEEFRIPAAYPAEAASVQLQEASPVQGVAAQVRAEAVLPAHPDCQAFRHHSYRWQSAASYHLAEGVPEILATNRNRRLNH
jgi:hypothetical protein